MMRAATSNSSLPTYYQSQSHAHRSNFRYRKSVKKSVKNTMKPSTTKMLIDSTTVMLVCISLGMAIYSFTMHHRQHMVEEILDSHHEEAIDFKYLEAFVRQLQELLKHMIPNK